MVEVISLADAHLLFGGYKNKCALVVRADGASVSNMNMEMCEKYFSFKFLYVHHQITVIF